MSSQVSHLDIGETLLQAGVLVILGVSEVVEVVGLQFIQVWVGVLQMRRSKKPVHDTVAIHLGKDDLKVASFPGSPGTRICSLHNFNVRVPERESLGTRLTRNEVLIV